MITAPDIDYTAIHARIRESLADEEDFSGLSHAERTFMRVAGFHLNGPTGGLWPYLADSTGTSLSEVCAALDGMGATSHRLLLLSAADLICPNRDPDDDEERLDDYDPCEGRWQTKEILDFDKAFFEIEEILDAKLNDYAAIHLRHLTSGDAGCPCN